MVDKQYIRINVSMGKSFSYLEYHTDSIIKASSQDVYYTEYSFIKKIEVDNQTDVDYEDFLIHLEFSDDIFSCRDFHTGKIPSRTKCVLKADPQIKVDVRKLYQLNAVSVCSVFLSLKNPSDGKELSSLTKTIKILPITMACDDFDRASLLFSKYCLTSFPEMVEIHQHANEEKALLSGSENASIIGYQNKNSSDVINEVSCIYRAIHNHCDLTYSNPPNSTEIVQNVRLPNQVLKTKLATCLDLVILFCSALLEVGLHPILILTNKHAFAGCFLHEYDSFSGLLETRPNVVYSDAVAEDRNLILVECTSMTNSHAVPFSEAMQIGQENLRAYRGTFEAIDVYRAQQSVFKPIPIANQEGEVDFKIPFVQLQPEEIEDMHEYQGTPIPENDVNDRFSTWEKKLLDLSGSNKLVSFRFNKDGSNFCLLVPPSGKGKDLFEFLKKQDGTCSLLSFPSPLSGNDDLSPLIQDKMAQESAKEKLKENTLFGYADSKTMRMLIKKDSQSREETGSPTLYLSIGLLKGSDSSGKSEREIKAPFLLLPVRITKDRYGDKYKIVYDIEELMVNKTFFEYYKMKKGTDYDNLYTVTSHNEFDDILATLRSNHSGDIQVDENVCFLSNFLFTHMVMWQDILDRQDVLEKNVIIHSLLENRSFIQDEPLDVDNADELDNMIDFAAPLPYDSTQLRAIRECAKGNSFILDGPPGTGKSQTIVNMIVNAFYYGKTVLFVAEKQAALEVVRQRLASLGLDIFALQLYSSKTNKQAFFSQLSRTMDFGKKTMEEDFRKTCEDIEAEKKTINDELRRLHSHKKHYYSLYEAITKELSTSDIKLNLMLPEEFLDSYDAKKDDDIKNSLLHISRILSELASFEDNLSLSCIRFGKYSFQDQNRLSEISERLVSSLARVRERFGYFNDDLRIDFSPTYQNIRFLKEAVLLLKDDEIQLDCFAKMDVASYLAKIGSALEEIRPLADLENSLYGKYDVTKIDQVDAGKAKEAYSRGTNIFNRKKARKNALEIIRPMLLKSPDSCSDEELVQAIDTAIEYKKRKNDVLPHKFLLSEFFSSNILDDLRNFGTYYRIYQNTKMLYELLLKNDRKLFEKLHTRLGSLSPLEKASFFQDFTSFEKELESFLTERDSLLKDYPMDFEILKEKDFFQSHKNLLHLFLDEEKQYMVDQYTRLLKDYEHLESLGLHDLLFLIQKGEIPSDDILRTYEHVLSHSFVVTSFVMDEENSNFDSKAYEETIRKYQSLIQKYNALSVGETVERITSKFENPELKRSQSTPIGALRKLVMNSGKGISIRNTLFRFEDIIRTYFPCFLMSPLAAAQYLDVNSGKFDIVIFDEASQIPTSEAVGPIARGNSLIVAGDPQQMPPTSYFQIGQKEEEDGENMDFSLYQDAESLLDDCIAIGMPRIRLAFHYRSKHESLIQFSNRNFYGGDLFTFPSSDNLTSHISFVHVDPGQKRKGSEISQAEINAILDILKEILENEESAKKSVGIIVFNSNQQEKLEDEVDSFLSRNPKYLSLTHWNEEDSTKKLFVKNLENVQGDERDIIILSVGFAKGADGKAIINGPLALPKGERRLNVATSRSIEQMIVVSTIYANDIDETGRKNLGAKNLKDFLLFAQDPKGFSYSPSEDSKNQDLAYFICRELAAKGFECDVSVGSSEFKVDLAVRRKGGSDYLLGILLDEKPLNKNVSCRDRFYVEPVILRNLRWKILRVYTVSFLRYKKRTIQKIIETIEDCQKEETEPANSFVPVQLKEHHITKEDFSLKEYEPLEFSPLETPLTDLDPETYYPELSSFLSELIKKEYPISRNRILELSKKKMGLGRMTQKNVQAILSHVRMLSPQESKDYEDSVFYWPNGCELEFLDFRVSSRDVLDVSKEEILPLLNAIIKLYKDIDKEELLRVASEKMQASSLNSKVRRKLEYVIHESRESGKLLEGYHENVGYQMN